jgi:hypothetical protein
MIFIQGSWFSRRGSSRVVLAGAHRPRNPHIVAAQIPHDPHVVDLDQGHAAQPGGGDDVGLADLFGWLRWLLLSGCVVYVADCEAVSRRLFKKRRP